MDNQGSEKKILTGPPRAWSTARCWVDADVFFFCPETWGNLQQTELFDFMFCWYVFGDAILCDVILGLFFGMRDGPKYFLGISTHEFQGTGRIVRFLDMCTLVVEMLDGKSMAQGFIADRNGRYLSKLKYPSCSFSSWWFHVTHVLDRI